MSKTLKGGETFLRFLLDRKTPKKQIRFILFNCSEQHLHVIVEIIHNLVRYQINLPKNLKKLIKKRKRSLVKLISLFKKRKQKLQQEFIQKHHSLIIDILLLAKHIIFMYFL